MATCTDHAELLPGCHYCRTGTEPDVIPQYPLTCGWCRNSPASHVAVYDVTRPKRPGAERTTTFLCGPCGHSVTILPSSFQCWWLFRLTSDGHLDADTCDAAGHGLEPLPVINEADD